MTTIRDSGAAIACTATVFFALPVASLAQQASEPSSSGLEEITVTATRTGETRLQNTPLAVSAFTSNQLEQSAISDIKDLTQYVPNLSIGQLTASPEIYIRGIGSNAVFNGSDPDVTMQVDGVYIARAFAQLTDFTDLEQIEVLRGPQGTLYGRNAVGGVINLISRAPTDEFVGQEQFTVGSYNTIQNQAYVSGPLVSGILDGSVAVNYIYHDGYDKNIVPDTRDVDGENHAGIRGQLRWLPVDSVDATTRFDYTRAHDSIESYDHILAPLPFPAPLADSTRGNYYQVALDNPGTNRETDWGVAEDVRFTFSDMLSLKSLTAYRNSSYDVFGDVDGWEQPVANVIQEDRSGQVSQEFDLNGHLKRLDFVTGLYYFREHETSINEVMLPPSIATAAAHALVNQVLPNSYSTSEAVFAQGTYHLTDDVKLTLGGRYTEDTKELYQHYSVLSYADAPVIGPVLPGFPFIAHVEPRFHAFTPKAGLDWQATPDSLLYFSFTEGFKSGGNNYAAANLRGISYLPEHIKSYEAGAKPEWLDRRLRVNLTAFDYDYTDLQVQQVVAPGLISIGNAATATVRGVELESQAQVTQHLALTLNGAYLNARYDSYPAASVAATLIPYVSGSSRYSAASQTYDASGNYLDAAPKLSLSVSGQYTQPIPQGEVYGRVEYYWQDRVYFDPTNVPIFSQGPYGLTNLAAGYNSPGAKWKLELLAKNVTNRGYFITISSGLVPAGLSGQPRVFLLRATRNF